MKHDTPEHRLSHFCCELADRVLVGDCWHTAVDTGTQTVKKTLEARFAWENHRKWMGIKPAHLDLYIYQRDTGIYGQFELKWGDNEPSDNQNATINLLKQRGIPTGWGRSVRAFYEWLVTSGFRLHGNAANIAIEVQMRLDAAHAAAPAKLAKRAAQRKKGGGKPRAPRYTGRGITSGMLVGR